MDEEPEAIPVNMPDDEVASMFERYNWLSAPVVDDKHRDRAGFATANRRS